MAATAIASRTPPLPMAVHRYFEVALYLLVLSGFAMLAATGGLDLPTILLVSAGLALRGYLLVARQKLILAERWATSLTLGYIVFYLADFFVVSASFVGATVHLVLFIMVVRLFSAQKNRDYYFLAVLAVLMVLAAAILTVDSTFLIMFGFFALCAVATVILIEMQRSAARATVPSNAGHHPHRLFSSALTGFSLAIVALIAPAAAAIFFVLPRVSSGYFSEYASRNQFATGFSDQVQLGGIGEIQQSSAVVMHVQIDGDQSGTSNLKWRGVSLSTFDGRGWSNLSQRRPAPRLPGGSFSVRPQTSFEPANNRNAKVIHYRVLMEPIGTNIFFLATTALEIRGNYRAVMLDSGNAVFDADPELPVGRYEGWSDIRLPAPAEFRRVVEQTPQPVYLRVPLLDSRIRQLAENITSGMANDYDKAAAIEQYLKMHFGYTLQLSHTSQRDPLANFLFERKQGHCEYFASAMAVMLRTLGIPSRVVNGFRGGELNDLTSQYVVRASDAHSWVEAYFPDYGWVSFDPTPATVATSHTGWSRALLYLDAWKSFWREWIVDYDVRQQQILGQQAAHGGQHWLFRMRHWYRTKQRDLVQRARRLQNSFLGSPWQWGVWGTGSACLLLLAVSSPRLWRALQRQRLAVHPDKFPRHAATVWYQRMTHTLADRGWRKSPTHTPDEFLRSIEDERVRRKVAQFTRRYEAARFDDSVTDARQLPQLYQEISSMARR